MDDNEEKLKNIKLKSEMYHHDSDNIQRREEKNRDALMWGFVLGFLLFIVLLIIIVIFAR